MSFLRKLFGLQGGSADHAGGGEAIEHEGFTIRPAPIAEGGQFRLCAIISRQVNGETREHRMIRADMFGSRDEASEAAVRKAKQMIKEQGERLFN
jgi:hypothetical protein